MTPQKHWPAPKQPPPFDILTVATKNLFYERCLKHQKPDIFPNPNAMDAPLDFNDISVGTPFSVMTRVPDILRKVKGEVLYFILLYLESMNI